MPNDAFRTDKIGEIVFEIMEAFVHYLMQIPFKSWMLGSYLEPKDVAQERSLFLAFITGSERQWFSQYYFKYELCTDALATEVSKLPFKNAFYEVTDGIGAVPGVSVVFFKTLCKICCC